MRWLAKQRIKVKETGEGENSLNYEKQRENALLSPMLSSLSFPFSGENENVFSHLSLLCCILQRERRQVQ